MTDTIDTHHESEYRDRYERLRMALHDIGENPDAVRYYPDRPPTIVMHSRYGPSVSVETAWRAFSVVMGITTCFGCFGASAHDACDSDRPLTWDCGSER